MSGLEVPGLVVGLTGLIALVEKSLELWQSLAEAKEFGSELMRVVAQLSMEYYRFLAWARVSGVLQGPLSSTTAALPRLPMSVPTSSQLPFPDDLSAQAGAPIEKAAARIVAILAEVTEIAEKYRPKSKNESSPSGASSAKSTSVTAGLGTVLPIFGARHNPTVTSLVVQHRESTATLQENTPFRQRFLFTSKPWGKSDQKALTSKVEELSYWNDRLEKLLPSAIQQSLSTQALPGQILVDENRNVLETLLKAAEHQNEAVKAHAMLWKERMDFLGANQKSHSALEKYRRSASVVNPVAGSSASRCKLSLSTFIEGQNAPIHVAVEWYSFGHLKWSFDDIKIATVRLAEIVHLCSMGDRPKSLRVLDSICFMERPDSLGIVSRLPKDANPLKQPISLHSLLSKVPEVVAGFQPLSLERRLLLAQQLASSIYSFGLVRWFHKDFNCSNVVFFRDSSPAANIMLDFPFVTGFSISRPDDNKEKSLNKDLEAQAIYLHPDLRTTDPEKRPEYHRKYEMYSLGLLLFEIGIWNTIDRAVKNTLSPEEFKKKAIDRCTKDLPFFVGTKYRDVVLRCLTCTDSGSEENESSLDTLYWSVVLELAQCR